MRRWLPVLLILVLAFSVACGDDDDDGDDDGAAAPTATTATGAATVPAGGGATATTADEGDDNGDDGDAAAGQQIAQAQCFTCHSIDGSTLVGPTWQGLYGHDVKLEDGTTVEADEEYIRESILQPNAKIVEGFPAAMPTFDGILDDEQIANLIAYIKSLE